MSLSYKIYLSLLNNEFLNEENDWGQHYDLENQMLINDFSPLKHPILNQIKQVTQIKQVNQIKQLNPDLYDPESGLKQILENYTANQSNKSQCNCKSTLITSLIYVSHIVLFIVLFK
jgi:hypothetical protein